MQTFKNYFLLATTVLVLYACKPNNLLEIKATNFQEEVQPYQNLIFTFNQEIAPDSALNKWDTTAYIAFTPKVNGKFKWASKTELVFSPDIGFKPSTAYAGEVKKEIFKFTAKEKKLELPKKKDINFHTPYLKLESSNIFWSKGERGVKEIRLKLHFNYKIDLKSFTDLAKLSIAKNETSFRLISNTPTQDIEIATEEPVFKNYDKQLAIIKILKGLKCAEIETTSTEEITHEAEIPAKTKLMILEATANQEEASGYIFVKTNQTIELAEIENNLTIDPAISHTVEALDNGFMIKGDFDFESSYAIYMAKGAKGVLGGELQEEYRQAVSFKDLSPFIAFTESKAIYLTSKGSKNIGIKIANVPKVKLKVYKIYENNILNYLKTTGASYESEYSDYYDNGRIEDYGDVVLEREYDVKKDLNKDKGIHLLNLNFNEINQLKGIYVVQINSADDQWLKAQKVISISDIGLIVKETENDILVFANSILTAENLSSLQVNLISSNNQSVYTETANSEGITVFKDIKKKAPNFKIQMITASHEKDFNYILFTQTKVENSQYDIGGLRENTAAYQAFINLERNIYRPGETIHLNTILRDDKWQTTKDLPIKLKLILPNGKEFTTIRGNLNEQGALNTNIALPQETLTGIYNLEVYTANDVLLNAATLSVEEFLPDRIKVNVALDKKEYKVGDQIGVDATALNFFGPPATDRAYEVRFRLKYKEFSPKDFKGYNFYIKRKNDVVLEDIFKEGNTDAEGKIHEEFALQEKYSKQGLLEASIYTTVFDESGRPVNRVNNLDIATQEVFYGIKSSTYYATTGQPVTFNLVALTKNEKNTAANAKVQVIRHLWQTVLERNWNNDLRYVSQQKEEILEERNIQINVGGANFQYNPVTSGEYEIRIFPAGGESYVSEYLYAYGWGMTDNASFEVNKEGKIDIELDKQTYKVGEKAKVLCKTPFAGKMLITVERNKVYDYFYVNTDKKSASFEIAIKEEHLPNVYISATLIKPLTDGAIPLTVAHGYAPITVEKPDLKLPVTIQAAATSYSNTKQTITIKSNPNTEVNVAVVDEGILQLKNFASPNPYDFFFQKRALEVNAYNLYPKVFAEIFSKKSSTGGDGEQESSLAKRINPMANNRVNLVSYWSGILKTDGNGVATYTIDIPQFSGDLRIMATAYKNNAFGGTAKNMKVADPVVISTALPRFLSPGDEVTMPVMLYNTTDKAATVAANLKIEGNLEIIGQNAQNITIAPNQEAQVIFKLSAKPSMGTAKVIVVANAFNKNFTDKTEITIRPITSLLKTSGYGTVKAGSSKTINLANSFIPSSVAAKLIVSKSPMVEFSDNLSYLINYPHGCVEQTISAVFPQLYVKDLAKTMQKALPHASQVKINVQDGINKLQAMQLPNGSLAYWMGSDQESWWATAYGAHFLWEAKKAGYAVSDKMLNKILGYLQKQIKIKKLETYYFLDAQGRRQTKKIFPKEGAYTLYVLALAHEQDVATMNYYKANLNTLAIDSKYLLASTYLLLGDKKSFTTILPQNFSGERAERASGGSFYSYIRDEGIALNALIEAEPNHPQIPIMAKHLSEQIRRDKYLSTQENAFALLALGKIARQANKSDVKATLQAGGKSIANFAGEDVLVKDGIAGKNINLSASGSGQLYYFWQMEGLSANGEVKEEDNYLSVRKTFYNRLGNPITSNTFNQNDLVVIKVSINTTDGSSIENVAITDMLPAGFEIENPRLVETQQMSWIKGVATPEYFDIRDDRINFFTTATNYTQNFYYMVRVVSLGNFKMGPVSADAMYNGEYRSYNGAGEIRVVEKDRPVAMEDEKKDE